MIANQITAQIGSTDWQLVSVDSNSDQCTRCGKIRMHTMTVRNAVTGREMVLCFGDCLRMVTEGAASLDRTEAARLLDEAQETADAIAAEEAADPEILSADSLFILELDGPTLATRPTRSLFILELDGPTVSAADHREYLAELDAERGVERWMNDRGFWEARAQELYDMTHNLI